MRTHSTCFVVITNKKELRSKIVLILFLAVFTIAFSHAVAFAAPGDLDPSFGVGGKQFPNCGFLPRVKVLPDNSIIIAASYWAPGSGYERVCVTKLTPNGELDLTFGGGTGKVIQTTVDERGNELVGTTVRGITVQPSGRIVVFVNGDAAGSFRRGELLGFKESGVIDRSFGSEGRVLINYSAIYGLPHYRLVESAMDSDSSGNIYVAYLVPSVGDVLDGWFQPSRTNLLKYSVNGAVHTDSDTTGHLWTSILFTRWRFEFNAEDLKIQSDGKIVLAGTLRSRVASVPHLKALIRLHADGIVDYSFGYLGMVRLPEPAGSTDTEIRSIGFQTTGNIVAISGKKLHLLSPSGGTINIVPVWTSYGTYPYGGKIVVQSDDKVLQAETLWSQFGVKRYQSNLASDPTWGGGSFILTYFGYPILATDADVDSLRRFVVVGQVGGIAVARYLP